MRLFLIWPDTSQESVNLVSGLKQNGHEIVYWTSTKENEGKFPGVIIHDHSDAWVGIPPKELAQAEFDPPGEELIKKLFGVESIIITMMNKHFEGRCVDERKNFYYDSLRYWYGVLNKFKPEAIIFSDFPHPDYSYLIFELARLLKIKTLMFDVIYIADRMTWYNDFWEGSRALLEELAKNKGKKFALNDLNEDLQLYLKFHIAENDDIIPNYFQAALNKNNLINKIFLKIKITLKSLRDFTIFKKVPLYLKKLLINNPQKEYRRFYKPRPDFSKKFIYAPLHHQPECNTSPLGGIFVSQILMIEILSACLPEGWLIYVKEHPAQWMEYGLNYIDYRYPGYYRQIARIKNVQLVPVKTNNFSLVKKSQAVATVTGTIGWEAVLQQKSALIFGYPWYKESPGVWQINGVESCRRAIKEIVGGYRPDLQSVINYLKCLELASFRGYIDEWAENNLKLTKPERLANILKVINNELKKV